LSKHSDLAKELFKQGYNCSQSVVAAFCDETGLDFDTSLRIASSFGAGMGRLREVCGAVSGMFMVLGMKYGYTDPSAKQVKMEHYRLIQDMARRFEHENGSIICRELLNPSRNADRTVPREETDSSYRKRPCIELVEQVAMMLDEYILDKK